MISWLVQFWKGLYERLCPVQPLKVTVPVVTLDITFDWLRDYGPHWEPGCTAFWLEPDTEAERAAWHRKYRPVVDDFDQATLGRYQHFRELTDAQMIKQMAMMQGTTPAYAATQSQAYTLTNLQKQIQNVQIQYEAYQNQLNYLKRRNTLWDQLLGKGF